MGNLIKALLYDTKIIIFNGNAGCSERKQMNRANYTVQ